MEKRIIALGLSSSGKSCYLGVTVGFMCRKKMYNIYDKNRNLRRLTDTIEERMKSGRWVKKTIGREEYCFKKEGFFSDAEYALHDWNGEYFHLLGLDEDQATKEWNKAQEKIDGKIVKGDELRKLYEDDCSKADAMLLFIDSRTLLEDDDKQATRESLSTLIDILRKSKKKRVIVIVLTKADYLEGYDMFRSKDNKVDIKKVIDNLRNNYNSFISEVVSAGHMVSISAVSCIPKREHRNSNGGRGSVPNEKWSLEDMTYSNVDGGEDKRFGNDMLTPIRWLIANT